MQAVRDFVDERNWDQFHTPENLAKSISIEAGELLECYQWDATGEEADQVHVEEELTGRRHHLLHTAGSKARFGL